MHAEILETQNPPLKEYSWCICCIYSTWSNPTDETPELGGGQKNLLAQKPVGVFKVRLF